MFKALIFGLLLSAPLFAISDFELEWMNHPTPGTKFNSAMFENRVLVIETYFNTCPFCNYNVPKVEAMAKRYEMQPRVMFIDLGRDKNANDYKLWIEKHKPNHPVLKDGDRVVINQLGVTGFPSTYVVDCNGQIVAQTKGEWDAADIQVIEDGIETALQLSCNH